MRVFLSNDDKDRLNQAFEQMQGATLADDSVVFRRASEYLIDELWSKESQENFISLKILEKWIDGDKVYVLKANRSEYETFKEQLRRQYGMDLTFNRILIHKTQLMALNEESVIRAKFISKDSLERCKNKNYKKSENVRKPRGVRNKVIQAYCVALGVDYSELSVAQVENSTFMSNDASKLRKVLIQSFDHYEVIRLIENLALPEDKRKIGILWFPYRIPYSHIWAYKRLKDRIKTMESGSHLVREIVVDLASSPAKGNWTPTKLKEHLTEALGDNVSLAKKLKQENIIIILKNVDQKGAEDLKNIIEQFWHKIIKEIPPMDEGGMFLMLWIDRGQTADWKTLNNFPLLSSVCSVNIPDRFQQEHFDNELFLGVLARTFCQRELICQRQATVDWFWTNSNQGEPEDTLKAFYRRFGLKFESHKTDWEEWRR